MSEMYLKVNLIWQALGPNIDRAEVEIAPPTGDEVKERKIKCRASDLKNVDNRESEGFAAGAERLRNSMVRLYGDEMQEKDIVELFGMKWPSSILRDFDAMTIIEKVEAFKPEPRRGQVWCKENPNGAWIRIVVLDIKAQDAVLFIEKTSHGITGEVEVKDEFMSKYNYTGETLDLSDVFAAL